MKRLTLLALTAAVLVTTGCDQTTNRSGIGIAKVKVKAQANGLTIEQENIKKRVEFENKIGSIKHIYIISPYSGQVLLYSTVKGKVTSSGKRLMPKHWTGGSATVVTGRYTTEVLNDTGTFSSSIPYIYWWDVNDRYHQHFVTGGQMIHISNKPIMVKSVVINMEISQTNEDDDAEFKVPTK